MKLRDNIIGTVTDEYDKKALEIEEKLLNKVKEIVLKDIAMTDAIQTSYPESENLRSHIPLLSDRVLMLLMTSFRRARYGIHSILICNFFYY
jgi:predicted nucleotide-binding protein (sugar kinase/HSP70/actin superfamily)